MRAPVSPAIGLALLVIGTLVVHGCARKADESPVQHTVRKVPTETTEAPAELDAAKTQAEKTQADPLNAKETFQESLGQTLTRVDAELETLTSHVAALAEEARAEWNEKLAALNAKRAEAETKLNEIRKSSGEAWEHLRDGAQNAWDELQKAVGAAVKEF